MKVSKDLADAVMMISCIILVLAGTTDFDSASTKAVLMGILAVLAVGMGAVRVLSAKRSNQHSH